MSRRATDLFSLGQESFRAGVTPDGVIKVGYYSAVLGYRATSLDDDYNF